MPARFDRDEILDRALDVLLEKGPRGASVSAVARAAGAPSGSVYHRFASRDDLWAALWVRTVARFHEGFHAALDAPDPVDAAVGAARYVVRWSHENPREARLLAAYGRSDLVHEACSAELREAADRLDETVRRAIRRLARRIGATRRDERARLVFAIVDAPRAAVLAALRADGSVRPSWEDVVADVARAALAPITRR